MPVWVLSLEGADRRQAVSANLEAVQLSFQFFAATDGTGELTQAEATQLRYTEGHSRRSLAFASRFATAKLATDLSHLRLLYEMLAHSTPLALILEDDAALEPGFQERLQRTLRALPDDWDLLKLNACYGQRGERPIREGIFVDRRSACTLGYVARISFAAKVIDAVHRWKVREHIDNWWGSQTQQRDVQVYVVEPPLALFSSHAQNSTFAGLED